MVVKEQSGPASRRAYRKDRRASDEQRTRARIVDAAEALHGSLGPARTTISAVAQEAGVTRATVYRHFPDDEALFMACSSQWISRQQPPNPDGWSAEGDPLARLRVGLADIYRYYRAGEPMLTLVNRDAQAVPPRVRAVRIEAQERWIQTLLAPFPRRGSRVVRATVGHATAFDTWRSLCRSQGLSDRAAVELMVELVTVARDVM
jgi:AcrR family transcriptional regulator